MLAIVVQWVLDFAVTAILRCAFRLLAWTT